MASACWSCCEGTLRPLQQEVMPEAVAAEYHRGTLTVAPSCSNQKGTLLYEIDIAGRKNVDV